MSLRREYMLKNNIKKNKSCHFLAPIFGYPLAANSPISYYLINSYVNTYEKTLILVFDNTDDLRLAKIIYDLQSNSYCREVTYQDNNKEIVIELDIPTNFVRDFDLFCKGKYSKFSEQFKNLLCHHYNRKSTRHEKDENGKPVTKIFDIIYPTREKMQDIAEYYNVDLKFIEECGEIIDPPNIEKETFKKITELYGVEQ